MRISVVIVEPRYQINLGYAARVSKNFGVARLYLVRPKCNHCGYRAIMYAKHAREMLERASVRGSIAEAAAGTFVIGSTGLWRKSKAAMYSLYRPDELAAMLLSHRIERVSLLIGREGTGLTPGELAACDAVAWVPAHARYPILNTSHALAILLYAMTSQSFASSQYIRALSYVRATSQQRGELIKLFGRRIGMLRRVRNKDRVVRAFAHIIDRANPTNAELAALAIAFSALGDGK